MQMSDLYLKLMKRHFLAKINKILIHTMIHNFMYIHDILNIQSTTSRDLV